MKWVNLTNHTDNQLMNSSQKKNRKRNQRIKNTFKKQLQMKDKMQAKCRVELNQNRMQGKGKDLLQYPPHPHASLGNRKVPKSVLSPPSASHAVGLAAAVLHHPLILTDRDASRKKRRKRGMLAKEEMTEGTIRTEGEQEAPHLPTTKETIEDMVAGQPKSATIEETEETDRRHLNLAAAHHHLLNQINLPLLSVIEWQYCSSDFNS